MEIAGDLNQSPRRTTKGLFNRLASAHAQWELKVTNVALSAAFEPAQGNPNGFLVHRLNHSATTTQNLDGSLVL